MDIFIGSLKSKFESPRQWKLYQRYWDIYKARQHRNPQENIPDEHFVEFFKPNE
jgi:hypothetical protein